MFLFFSQLAVFFFPPISLAYLLWYVSAKKRIYISYLRDSPFSFILFILLIFLQLLYLLFNPSVFVFPSPEIISLATLSLLAFDSLIPTEHSFLRPSSPYIPQRIINLTSLSIIALICLTYVLDNGPLYRLTDSSNHTNFISQYLGFIILYLYSLSSTKSSRILLSVLLFLFSSSSSIIAFIVYNILLYFKQFNFPVFSLRFIRPSSYIQLFLLIFVSTCFVFYGQMLRERQFSNLSSFDRIQFYVIAFDYVKTNFQPINYLLGITPFSLLDISSVLDANQFFDYLNAESNDLTARNLHSEFLRIFIHYGALGTICFVLFLKRLLYFSTPLYVSILLMSMASSVVLAFPVFMFLISFSTTSRILMPSIPRVK